MVKLTTRLASLLSLSLLTPPAPVYNPMILSGRPLPPQNLTPRGISPCS